MSQDDFAAHTAAAGQELAPDTLLWTTWQADCETLGLTLTPEQIGQMQAYYDLLTETNYQMNLIRLGSLSDFLNRHLLDSLAIHALIPMGARLVDLGSGGGFPLIPLSIARPDITAWGVESTGKKCRFLDRVKTELALSHLTITQTRGEEFAHVQTMRESFDMATARAVAALPALLELTIPLLKTGGHLIAMKGLSYEEELAQSRRALTVLHTTLETVIPTPHPKLSGARILLFKKQQATPLAYPRSPGTPTKKPL